MSKKLWYLHCQLAWQRRTGEGIFTSNITNQDWFLVYAQRGWQP